MGIQHEQQLVSDKDVDEHLYELIYSLANSFDTAEDLFELDGMGEDEARDLLDTAGVPEDDCDREELLALLKMKDEVSGYITWRDARFYLADYLPQYYEDNIDTYFPELDGVSTIILNNINWEAVAEDMVDGDSSYVYILGEKYYYF